MHEEVKARPESPTADSPSESGSAGDRLRKPRVRLGAVVAIALAAGLVAWLVVDRRGESSTPAVTTLGPAGSAGVGPVALTRTGLRNLSRKLGHPIYWTGSKSGYTYEVTQTRDGKVYVRYLPAGIHVGDKRSNFMIIVTYPFPKAYNSLKAVAAGQGVTIPGGGLALVDASYPKSVHLAYPGVNYQVEIYDPSPRQSRRTAFSGDIRPVR